MTGAALRLAPGASFERDELVELCSALALAESILARAGYPLDAARMTTMFELVEDRLVG